MGLEKAKHLFLLGWVFLAIDIVDVWCLVVPSKLGRGSYNALRRSCSSPFSGPIQTITLTKDAHALLLLEATVGVFLIGFEPRLFLGTLDVGVVPVSSSLHVRNIIHLDLSPLDSFLGVEDGHQVGSLATFHGFLEGLHRSALEAAGTHTAEVLLSSGFLLLLLLELFVLLGSKSGRDIIVEPGDTGALLWLRLKGLNTAVIGGQNHHDHGTIYKLHHHVSVGGFSFARNKMHFT